VPSHGERLGLGSSAYNDVKEGVKHGVVSELERSVHNRSARRCWKIASSVLNSQPVVNKLEVRNHKASSSNESYVLTELRVNPSVAMMGESRWRNVNERRCNPR
jgi:hypothetical protein